MRGVRDTDTNPSAEEATWRGTNSCCGSSHPSLFLHAASHCIEHCVECSPISRMARAIGRLAKGLEREEEKERCRPRRSER